MVHVPHDDVDAPLSSVMRVEWNGRESARHLDHLAREEPLAIHVGGIPIAVVMRTPGHDVELVRGFLMSERIVDRLEDIVSIRHCDRVEDGRPENGTIRVRLSPQAAFEPERLRRNLFVASSCGICGKASLEAALQTAAPLPCTSTPTVAVDALYTLPTVLRGGQTVFEETGGLHAAALFDRAGQCLGIREDVGRHNAVDKILGYGATLPTWSNRAVLLVSGRVSFEVVQKALAARIPVVAAISAPTSLAVDLAHAAGITLIGFVRGERLCVYTHPVRVTP